MYFCIGKAFKHMLSNALFKPNKFSFIKMATFFDLITISNKAFYRRANILLIPIHFKATHLKRNPAQPLRHSYIQIKLRLRIIFEKTCEERTLFVILFLKNVTLPFDIMQLYSTFIIIQLLKYFVLH